MKHTIRRKRVISNVTSCPFEDIDQLAQFAETGVTAVTEEIDQILNHVKKNHPELSPQMTRLDDLNINAINMAINETLRGIICTKCDQDKLCHPAT